MRSDSKQKIFKAVNYQRIQKRFTKSKIKNGETILKLYQDGKVIGEGIKVK